MRLHSFDIVYIYHQFYDPIIEVTHSSGFKDVDVGGSELKVYMFFSTMQKG